MEEIIRKQKDIIKDLKDKLRVGGYLEEEEEDYRHLYLELSTEFE